MACHSIITVFAYILGAPSGVTSLNGARPLNSNTALTKYIFSTVSNNNKKVAPFLAFIAILAPPPPEAFCTPIFFRVDRTLSCARYSWFFGIKTVNS